MLAKFSKMLLVINKYYYYSILQFFLKTQFFIFNWRMSETDIQNCYELF